MIQELVYISSSLFLNKGDNNGSYLYDNVSSLVTNTSSMQINAYSGSVLLVSFPIENTNVYYNFPTSSNNIKYTDTSSYANFQYNFNISDGFSSDQLSGSRINIYNNSKSTNLVSVTGSNAYGYFTTISGNELSFSVYGSGSYTTYMYVYNMSLINTTSSLIFQGSGSNSSVTYSSFTSTAYNNYMVSFSVISNV